MAASGRCYECGRLRDAVGCRRGHGLVWDGVWGLGARDGYARACGRIDSLGGGVWDLTSEYENGAEPLSQSRPDKPEGFATCDLFSRSSRLVKCLDKTRAHPG